MTLAAFCNLVAMMCAIVGSNLFTKDKFTTGAKVFTVGNVLNVASAAAVGNIGLLLTMLGFMWFTVPMYDDPDGDFSIPMAFIGCVLMTQMGISPKLFLGMDWLGLFAAVTALTGSYFAVVGRVIPMAWCWIVADIIFVYLGWRDALPGLVFQSIVFIYYGIVRVSGYKLVGFVRCEKKEQPPV